MVTEEKKDAAGKTPKAERTKELLYRTAMQLLIERGFRATTIRDICSAAGVSVGTFYLYFESKHAILFEIVRKLDHYFTDEVQPALEGSGTEEKILRYFEAYGAYLQALSFDTVCVLFSVEDVWITRYRPMHRVLTAILMEGQLKGEIRREQEAEDLCRYLFMGATGVIFTWCTMQGQTDLQQQIRGQIRLQLNSILQEPGPAAGSGS